MAGKMTWHAWVKLIEENETWLRAQPRTLEREHILGILADIRTDSTYYDHDGDADAVPTPSEPPAGSTRGVPEPHAPAIDPCEHPPSDHGPSGCRAQVPRPDGSVARWDFCPCDDRTGARCGVRVPEGKPPGACGTCDGTGYTRHVGYGNDEVVNDCDACGGTGRTPSGEGR